MAPAKPRRMAKARPRPPFPRGVKSAMVAGQPQPRLPLPHTILQIIPKLETGGAERTTVDLTAALTAAGWRALVVSEGGRMVPEVEAAGGQHIRLPAASKSPVTILANAWRLRRLIAREKVSLVHARSRAPAWSALLAARLAGVPFVTTYHGIYHAGNAAKRWYNSVMVRGDAVIANSQWTAERIRADYGRVPPLTVIPRGVDFEVFDPAAVAPERIARLREQWRASNGDVVVLLPGRLTRWKGQGVLIEALAQLKRAGKLPPLIAVLAGDPQGRDSYAAELRQAATEAGLKEIVVLPGHVSDMAAAYLAADIVISASTKPEPFGRVPVEAGAMGRPVIATDHGGARETVIAEVSGLLIPPSDSAALAGALERLIALGPEGRAAMGAKARARVRECFTRERMCADTIALYRELLGG